MPSSRIKFSKNIDNKPKYFLSSLSPSSILSYMNVSFPIKNLSSFYQHVQNAWRRNYLLGEIIRGGYGPRTSALPYAVPMHDFPSESNLNPL